MKLIPTFYDHNNYTRFYHHHGGPSYRLERHYMLRLLLIVAINSKLVYAFCDLEAILMTCFAPKSTYFLVDLY